MKLRQSLFCSLLLAVGYVLHLVVTPFLGGMKPDLLLSMLFLALLLVDEPRVNLQTGILAGLIAAMTTTFPGGQIPNIIDKVLVTIMIIGVLKLLRDRVPVVLLSGIVSLVGTLASGTIFLSTALLIAGLPVSFNILFMTVVLPATAMNTVITVGLVTVLQPAISMVRQTI